MDAHQAALRSTSFHGRDRMYAHHAALRSTSFHGRDRCSMYGTKSLHVCLSYTINIQNLFLLTLSMLTWWSVTIDTTWMYVLQVSKTKANANLKQSQITVRKEL